MLALPGQLVAVQVVPEPVTPDCTGVKLPIDQPIVELAPTYMLFGVNEREIVGGFGMTAIAAVSSRVPVALVQLNL